MNEIELLRNLVKFNTVNDEETENCTKFIGDYLEKFGFALHVVGKCLVATRGSNPKLGFLGHIDTVPVSGGWSTDPFTLTEKDGKLYGLGACDMKGGIAAFITAATQTDADLKLYFTDGEETTLNGVKELVAGGEKFPSRLIIAEPTDGIPIVGTKGPTEFRITFRGVSVHSSDPDKGHNAIYDCVEFITSLREFGEELRRDVDNGFSVPFTTYNVGVINGGVATNSSADKCTMSLEFRKVRVEQRQLILDTVEKLLEPYDATYEICADVPPFANDDDISDIEKLTAPKQTANYFTEASFIKNSSCIILGPGPITAHEKNEYITIDSLKSMVGVYKEIIEK